MQETLSAALTAALGDLTILAGQAAQPQNIAWQDVAGTAAVNLEVLSAALREARAKDLTVASGYTGVFPDPIACLAAALESVGAEPPGKRRQR